MDLYLHKPVAFSVMAKPTGPICNLNCTYCYYLEKQKIYKKQTNFRMSDAVLEAYIKNYIDAQQVPEVTFVWQGGEPTLLGIDFYKKAVEFQNRYAGKKRIGNSFQTNGTLLTDDWCRFFAQNNFLVGISIDGPEEIHDMHRKYKTDKPSFADVMRGVNLLKKHNAEFNTLSVVHRHNAKYPLEIYRFLKDIGSGFIQFIPIVERVAEKKAEESLILIPPSYGGDAKVTDWSVIPEEYGNFLISIFDEWVRHDVGKYYVQIFDVTLANWVGEMPGLCVFSETCGDAVVMEHNGDIYSCDHFVYPEYKLGNILEDPLISMIRSETQNKFGSDKLDKLPKYCIECEYRFACHGECPKHRFINTPDGEPGLNYLCQTYKMFFGHVHPYMQYMADELSKKRAPANVMKWVKSMDDQKAGKVAPDKKVIGRNDPCICGSGKKYKNCCYAIFNR